jgi:hypothetical protein
VDVSGKVWAVVIDGKSLALWDLPIEDVEEIAGRHDVGPWLRVIDNPMSTPGLARDLVTVAAKKLGTGMPEVVSVRDLWALFELVDEDLPIEYTDGIPVPKEPETTG